ncbi:MAG: hypothetical protein ACLTMP_08330 [Eggerthella lenta]
MEEPTGGSTYGMRDVQTDDQGALYLHLTPLEATDKLVVASWNGRDYSGLSERNLDGTFAIALAPTEAAVLPVAQLRGRLGLRGQPASIEHRRADERKRAGHGVIRCASGVHQRLERFLRGRQRKRVEPGG